MPKIRVLSRNDWPTWVSPTQVRLDEQILVQVDDEIPFTVQIPKDQVSEATIRQAVKQALADQKRRQAESLRQEIEL